MKNIHFVSSKQRRTNIPEFSVRFVRLVVVFSALSVAGAAQCISNDSLAAARSAAGAVRATRSMADQLVTTPVLISDAPASPSIVGLWHVRFFVANNEFQEAYQIYNEGGTEVHNPKVDPRGGSVCLGAWEQSPMRTFQLNHRVWLYNNLGVFQGVGHLMETLTLDNRGANQTGSFMLEIYDPNGNLVDTIPGTVIGERVPASGFPR